MFFFLPFATTAPVLRRPWLVLALFAACVAVFVLQCLPVVGHWMNMHLILFPAGFSVGRSLASTFMHVNVGHLVGNMLYLYLFGAAVETKPGWWRFLTLYLMSGLAGNVLYTLLATGEGMHQGTVGASGCISGLLGAYVIFFWNSEVRFKWLIWFYLYVRAGEIEIFAPVVAGLYFVLDLLGLLLSGETSGVNNAAHLGGIGVGLVLGYAWRKRAPEGSFEHQPEKTKAALPPQLRLAGALESSRPETALPLFEKMLAEGAADAVHSVLALKLGALYEQAGEYDKALSAYKIAANRREDAKFAAEAVFAMMRVYGEQKGDVDHALELGQRFLSVFPVSARHEEIVAWMRQHDGA